MSTTQTQTAPVASTPVKPNKDSMKSTWRQADPKTWNFYQRSIVRLGVYPVDLTKPIPKHDKSEPTPHLAQWSQHVFILFHSIVALLMHQGLVSLTGWSIHPFWIVNFYVFMINHTLIKEVRILTQLGHRYGYLDGDAHPRDGIPDAGVGKIFWALYKTTGSRIAAMTWLAHTRGQAPFDVMNDWMWWGKLFVQIGLYGVVLDFFFYTYHRIMHEIPFMWRFHRTHHLTKHPNALLSAYADEEQEVLEMMVIPILSWFTLRAIGLPMDFYAWWICKNYIMYTEVWGHCGVRVHLVVPSTFAGLLTKLNMELCVEDHDLHHRKGWRKSQNYGKQSRVWDRLFGTCGKRLETFDENVDYDNQAVMPLF